MKVNSYITFLQTNPTANFTFLQRNLVAIMAFCRQHKKIGGQNCTPIVFFTNRG